MSTFPLKVAFAAVLSNVRFVIVSSKFTEPVFVSSAYAPESGFSKMSFDVSAESVVMIVFVRSSTG